MGPIRVGVLLVFWLGGAVLSLEAADKFINLRTERIQTAGAFQAAAMRAGTGAPLSTRPLTGLILIQFTAEPLPAWKETLEGLGVKLLRYVPQDAFVAVARGARLDELGALPFVQWVGPYRPDHKLERSLALQIAPSFPGLQPRALGAGAQGGGLPPANGPVPQELSVAVLLAPGATDAEVGATRGRLARLHQESHPQFGAVLRGTVTAAGLAALVESPVVLWVEPAVGMKMADAASSQIVAGVGGGGAVRLQELGDRKSVV